MRVLSVLLALSALPSFLAYNPLLEDQSTSIKQSIDLAVNAAAVDFTLVTRAASWPARAVFGMRLLNRSISGTNPDTGNRQLLPSPVMVVFGGELYDNTLNSSLSVGNDVWASTDGKYWLFAAGITSDGSQAPGSAGETSFVNRRAPAVATVMAHDRLYRIGGNKFEGKRTVVDEVWSSTDAIHWVDQSENSWSPLGGLSLGDAAVDATGTIVAVGGFVKSNDETDVWMSTNQGLEWRMQSEAASFGPRSMSTLISLPVARSIEESIEQSNDESNKQAFILFGGQSPDSKNNEVWLSDNQGVSWSMISARAPWSKRSGHQALVTKDGLIVLVGGVEDLNQPTNDVWVSQNGGWTWNRCSITFPWSGRRDQQSIIHPNGHLLVMGGYQFDQSIDQQAGELNDVWRSTLSFHDLEAVSSQCNSPVPSCGSGLKCLYSSETVVAADSSYVSCGKCDINDASIQSANRNLWIAISFAIGGCSAFFISLFVLFCVIKRSKNQLATSNDLSHQVAWAEANQPNQTNNQTNNQHWASSDRGHEPIFIQTNDGYEQTQPSTEFTPMRN